MKRLGRHGVCWAQEGSWPQTVWLLSGHLPLKSMRKATYQRSRTHLHPRTFSRCKSLFLAHDESKKSRLVFLFLLFVVHVYDVNGCWPNSPTAVIAIQVRNITEVERDSVVVLSGPRLCHRPSSSRRTTGPRRRQLRQRITAISHSFHSSVPVSSKRKPSQHLLPATIEKT